MRNLQAITLFFLGLILFSCNSTKHWNNFTYKKYKSKHTEFSLENYKECVIKVYSDKKTKKPLSGKYKFKNGTYQEYFYFKDGKYNGLRELYHKGRLVTISELQNGINHGRETYYLYFGDNEIGIRFSNYRNGYKHGEESVYDNYILTQRRIYENGIARKEYYFDEKGDTIDILTYTYDPYYRNFDITKYLVKNEKGHYSFKGKITVDSEKKIYEDFPFVYESAICSDITNFSNCSYNDGAYLVSTVRNDYIFYSGSRIILFEVYELE